MVSIIWPIYNEERYIENCIQSVLKQDIPADSWELLLIDGMSTDNTRIIAQPYINQYPNIRMIDNPKRTAPCAMNIGIRTAKGEYICRIDAHSLFPSNYISTLLSYIEELPNAANVGGVCDTKPANDSKKAKAIAITCRHPLGVGNSTFRTRTISKPKKTDTVPYGFWRKELFNIIGLFDEELTRNQDDEFNARTIRHGYKIYLVPKLSVSYYSRDSILKTGRMFYQYGLFKPLVNHKIKRPATTRQFVPLFFVLGLIVGLPLTFLHPLFLLIYIASILQYLLLICCVGVRYRNAYLPLVFATIHICYGWGYIEGMWKLLTKQSFQVDANR